MLDEHVRNRGDETTGNNCGTTSLDRGQVVEHDPEKLLAALTRIKGHIDAWRRGDHGLNRLFLEDIEVELRILAIASGPTATK